MSNTERIVSNIILTILIGFGVLALFRWESTTTLLSNYFFDNNNAEQIYDQNAVLLATLHEGTSTPASLTVSRFEILLEKLERKCTLESKEAIARSLINTERTVRGNGKKTSLFKIGDILYQQIPDKTTKGTTCEETAYALGLYSSF